MSLDFFLDDLEKGILRAAEPIVSGDWKVNLEVKQKILEVFRAGTVSQLGEFVDKTQSS